MIPGTEEQRREVNTKGTRKQVYHPKDAKITPMKMKAVVHLSIVQAIDY